MKLDDVVNVVSDILGERVTPTTNLRNIWDSLAVAAIASELDLDLADFDGEGWGTCLRLQRLTSLT